MATSKEKRKTKRTKSGKTEVKRKAKKSKVSAKPDMVEDENGDLVTRNLGAVYRPHNLDGFVGQDAAVKKLKGWIKKKQFPQSILIEGETGSGKTTLARMIARYVNCETMSSCGKCSFCQYKKDLPDVVYRNSGEFSTVEEIRKLISTTMFAPTYRRRIYIIDEVHLLSGKALEALLIPLEEPTPGTMWILCTTDLAKIKSTVQNRCQVLNLRKVPSELIVERLYHVLDQEGIEVNKKNKKNVEGALYTIADFSEGQVRQALTLLDGLLSAINSGDADFDDDSVISLQDKTAGAELDKLAVSLFLYTLNQDLESIVGIIDQSKDATQLVRRALNLTDWLIKYSAGAVKYVPYNGKYYFEAKKKLEAKEKVKINVSLALVMKIAHCLQQIEHTILTVPAIRSERYSMLQLSELVIDDVFSGLLDMSKPKKKK
jgi:DNA polymerase III subunit gamma/tau